MSLKSFSSKSLYDSNQESGTIPDQIQEARLRKQALGSLHVGSGYRCEESQF